MMRRRVPWCDKVVTSRTMLESDALLCQVCIHMIQVHLPLLRCRTAFTPTMYSIMSFNRPK
jgi:hypothetical protein